MNQIKMAKRSFPGICITVQFMLCVTVCYSNDGAFMAQGNHLIPMYESDISVKKEILTIKRFGSRQVTITVYYEFFNPKVDKEVEVGFEAASPSGDVDATPVKGEHPYMDNFTVNLNGEPIPYKIAIVSDSVYYKNGNYKSKTLAQAIRESEENSNYVDFFYVYHFKARFKKGINIIIHTYTLTLSSGIDENYDLTYILTAAKRWANRQIDDFTLQIDMGELQDITIPHSFFSNASEWQIQGTGKSIEIKKDKEKYIGTNMSEFFIRKGVLVFQKLNFKPQSELNLYSFNNYHHLYTSGQHDDGEYPDHFDYKRDYLPFSIEDQRNINDPADDFSRQVLKNLPFARRGNVFKSPQLQTYFEHQPWYMKDENYKPVLSELTPKEQAWVIKW